MLASRAEAPIHRRIHLEDQRLIFAHWDYDTKTSVRARDGDKFCSSVIAKNQSHLAATSSSYAHPVILRTSWPTTSNDDRDLPSAQAPEAVEGAPRPVLGLPRRAFKLAAVDMGVAWSCQK
jgi:hypothetical protein